MKTSRKLLICASTPGEAMGSRRIAALGFSPKNGDIIPVTDRCDLLICGVGMFQAEYRLIKALQKGCYGLVLSAGVAGAYDASTPLASAFMVGSCAFADCATEGLNGEMLPVVGSEFLGSSSAPFSHGLIISEPSALMAQMLGLPLARANTVNRIRSGSKEVERILELNPADLETMESAALAYACAMEGVRYAEIRCVSNHTLPKSEQKWMLKPAIEKLGSIIDRILDESFKKMRDYLEQ